MSRTILNALGGVFAVAAVVAIGTTVAWSNIVEPAGRAYANKAEFDQAFVDASAPSRLANTAANREKLRDLGWKQFKATVAK